MNENKIISLTDIEYITKICIDVLNCTEYLRMNSETSEAYELAKDIFKSLRKFFLAIEMHNKKLICISGLQGAGKTTLMKNFYGIDDNILNPTIGRGERIPVLITERDISYPTLYAIKILKDENGNYNKAKVELNFEYYDIASKGGNDNENEKTMYLELNVPYFHTYNDGVSFVLLPGFENKNDYLNNLIEFAVNSSDAAVFVFNETSFSNAGNERMLRNIQDKFGKNIVFAISGSDGSIDENEEVKQTCLKELNIPQNEFDRVTCVGSYNNKEKNQEWIEKFKNSLEKYAYCQTSTVTKNNKYILDEILQIKSNLYEILKILNNDSSTEIRDHHNDTMLKEFDKVVKKKKKEFERNLNSQFEVAKSESCKNLENEFSNRSKIKDIKHLFFGRNVKEQYTETREILNRSLKFNGNLYLPSKYIVLALEQSLKSLEQAQNTTNAAKLIDRKKNNEGKYILVENEKSDLIKDIAIIIKSNQNYTDVLKQMNPKKLMGAVAEVAIYYYMLNSYDECAKEIGVHYYKPALMNTSIDNVISGAESSKKFAVGIAGVMGIDLIEDGALNFISKIAGSLGVPLPAAGAVASIVIGVGAASVVSNDINRIQREDFNSARIAINGVYENLKIQSLEKYDEYMEMIRERLEDSLDELDGNTKKLIIEHNAKIKVNQALNVLNKISERYAEETYGVGTFIY